jgi:hypothetical protein
MYKIRLTSFVSPYGYIFIAALCLCQLSASGQINTDFKNNDLAANPTWTGNLTDFEINAYHQLHLKTNKADTSYLSTPLKCEAAMEWKFWVRLSFAPSANNHARIYLVADNQNPILANKTFYIQLGEAGSLDAITLFYKDGLSVHEVCRGSSGLIANPFSIRIRVVRFSNGTWKIASDPTGANQFSNEASGVELAPLPDGFFALFCRYTISNSTGFYFDDIMVNSYNEGTNPPLLIQALVSGESQILLNFNKSIEKSTSLKSSNFSLTDGTHPISVYADPSTGTLIRLDFSQPLPPDQTFTLSFQGITDLDGNTMPQKEITLSYHPIRPFDVVINEIMFDPGDNKEEFIELYNRSSKICDVSQLWLKVENTTSASQQPNIRICEPGQLISPGEFRVLVDDKSNFMKQYPLLSSNLVIEVNGFPPLSNEGGIITLCNSTGILIDKAGFNPELHFPMLRITSGVSLERVDPNGLSGLKDNWHSASETSGFSTPGKINSQHITQNPASLFFTLEPEQFTPDNDGKDDNLLIKYNSEKPGSMMTILIYNINGKPIRQLVSNVLLASENTFTWDGLTDHHTKAPAGIYVIYATVYSTSGDVRQFKKSTILATPLKR